MNPEPMETAKAFLIKAGIIVGALWFLGHLANLWLAPKLRSFFRKANRAIGPGPAPKPQSKPKQKSPGLTEARLVPGWDQLTRSTAEHERFKP
jgi:hypothetical protein